MMLHVVSSKAYEAIRFSIFILFSILVANPAGAVSFDFGISPSMTVIDNQPSFIPAAIINTANTPLDFGCAIASCGGLNVGATVGVVGSIEGLNALNFQFGPNSADSFHSQFGGRTLAPNETFNFTFGNVNLNPSEPIGTPFGTVLHPTFSFDIEQVSALVPLRFPLENRWHSARFLLLRQGEPRPLPSPQIFSSLPAVSPAYRVVVPEDRPQNLLAASFSPRCHANFMMWR